MGAIRSLARVFRNRPPTDADLRNVGLEEYATAFCHLLEANGVDNKKQFADTGLLPIPKLPASHPHPTLWHNTPKEGWP